MKETIIVTLCKGERSIMLREIIGISTIIKMFTKNKRNKRRSMLGIGVSLVLGIVAYLIARHKNIQQ